MDVETLELRHIRLSLTEPFTTSFGTVEERNLLILGAKKDGRWFYGETSPLQDPLYNHETTYTAREAIKRYVVPALKKTDRIEAYHDELSWVKGNRQAIAAGDMLLHQLRAYEQETSIAGLIDGVHEEAHCGVSIGVTDEDAIVDKIQQYRDAGYERIKIKIKPGQDIDYVATVRDHFPDIELMADANSAYSLDDADRLEQLDAYGLSMIEQPLGSRDIVNHSVLADRIKTPICLDESILSAADVRRAARIDACEVINLKPQRVSGLRESRRINQVCKNHGISLWIGGLVESGIGASYAVIAAALSEVTYPGDTSSSSRYFDNDVITPELRVEDGNIPVPDGASLCGEVDRDSLAAVTQDRWTF